MLMVHSARATVAVLLFASAACSRAQLAPTSGAFNTPEPVTVPLKLVHGLLTVPVMLNGHGPFQLILDSGAPLLVLPDTSQISKLQLRVVGQASVGGAGDGAMQRVPLAMGITASVGRLEVKDATGIIGVTGDAVPGVDGIIGGPLFRHAVVHVDWDANTV